jgi:hypothetical protein
MTEEITQTIQEIEIKTASIKEACCHYSYELLTGKSKGDIVTNRKGVHYIHVDLANAFNNLIVFLAHIDGAFEAVSNNQTPLSELEENVAFNSYVVGGIKIVGVEENKSVVISGGKYTPHGNISFDTPKIKLNGNYLYKTELIERLETVIDEVELYMNGKKAPEFEQAAFDFEKSDEVDVEFETAKV